MSDIVERWNLMMRRYMHYLQMIVLFCGIVEIYICARFIKHASIFKYKYMLT